jgi:hypothetical protein
VTVAILLRCGSIHSARARVRMPVAGARGMRLPANVCSTSAACVLRAQLDGASRSSANPFRRGSWMSFGSFHGSYPAFLLTCWFFRVEVARGRRRLFRSFSPGVALTLLLDRAGNSVFAPRA